MDDPLRGTAELVANVRQQRNGERIGRALAEPN